MFQFLYYVKVGSDPVVQNSRIRQFSSCYDEPVYLFMNFSDQWKLLFKNVSVDGSLIEDLFL